MTLTCPECNASVREDDLLVVVGGESDWYECPKCGETRGASAWGL